MKKKLLVLDLDGTLTNDAKEITPATRQALMEIQQQGARIVLASGRPTYGIMPLLEELELQRYGGYVLAYNGAMVIDCTTGDHLFAQLMDNDVIPTVARMAKEEGHQVLSYRGAEILATDADDAYVKEEARINKMPVRGVGDDFVATLPSEVVKLLVVGEPERLAETEQRFASALDPHGLWVYRSAPFFLEVVPQGIDKAESLKRLLQHIGLETDEMVCVGDGGNDVSMIRLAGVGVAMLNAPDYVKEAADWITPTDNNHDGVAEVIRTFF